MSDEDKLREAFHDAVAFSRAVGNRDYEAANIIWNLQKSKLSIAMPQANIINALVHRFEEEFHIPGEAVWASIVEAVDEMEVPNDGEGPEDGE